MVLVLTAMLGLWAIFVLAGQKSQGHGKACSLSHKLLLRFLETAALLFGSYAVVTVVVVFSALAYGKHFVLDYDIIFWFSCLILILYHRLTTDKASSILFKTAF